MFKAIGLYRDDFAINIIVYCSWVKEFGGRNGLNAILQSLNFCYDRSVLANVIAFLQIKVAAFSFLSYTVYNNNNNSNTKFI